LVIESISYMAWSVVGMWVVFDKLLIKFGYCMWCMAMGLGNLVTWCVRQWCKLNAIYCCVVSTSFVVHPSTKLASLERDGVCSMLKIM
jgi:hypothetical protein